MAKLIKGYSKSSISSNISEMVHAGKSRSQAVAIALRVATEAAHKAGKPHKAPPKPGGHKKG